MDRHIGAAVLAAVLLVFVAFLGLMTLFALLEELGENEAGYTLAEAFWYVTLTTPWRVYEVLPYVVFLGALIGLGSLAGHSEIVVLRANGVSPARIFLSLMLPAGLVFAAGFVLGEWVAPRGEEQAELYKLRAVGNSDVVRLSRAYWYREGDMMMRVQGLGDDGELIGITQYWYGEGHRLQSTVAAERAAYVAGSDPHWRLENVKVTRLRGARVESESMPELRWTGKVNPRLLSIRVLVDPRRLSLGDLLLQIRYMVREGLTPAVYELAFWSKLLQPLAVLGLALVALGFVLGPLREVGMGVRLSVGIFVGLGFKYLQDLFAPMSMVYALPPMLAVLVPILACWALGAWGLRRVA
jgi:lipopolysaccharide export system permease protein